MSCENKIEYYFLRISAERFTSDLSHFSKDINSFSEEQLCAIVSYFSVIEQNAEKIRRELEKRLGIK